MIRHLNSNPRNNRTDNLTYGTRQQNEQEKEIHAFARLAGISIDEAMKMAGRATTNRPD